MTAPGPEGPGSPVDVAGVAYGVRVRGALPAGFQRYLLPLTDPGRGAGPSLDVSFRVIHALPEVEPIWATDPAATAGGRLTLFELPEGFGLAVDGAGKGLFRIAAGEIAIEWIGERAAAAQYFFSYALPLWLESGGVPVLHASAVAFGKRAVAFVGRSGVGKSTLCAGLVSAGCAFVADDGVPLREGEQGEWWCSPGPPWLKLWPSALEGQLDVPAAELPKVHGFLDKRMMASGGDHAIELATELDLAGVYVLEGLEREDPEVTITPCTRRDAVVRLIEHSLAPAPVAALGLSARRLTRLTRLVTTVPVKSLRYPAGGAHWPRIHRAIRQDL